MTDEKIETQNVRHEDGPGNIRFELSGGADEVMRFEPGGDIYVRGKLVEQDKEVVDGLRHFLADPSVKAQVMKGKIVTLAMWITKEFDAGRMDNVERGREHIRDLCRQAELTGITVMELPEELINGQDG